MSYRLLRPLLFCLPPEWAHRITLLGLRGYFPATRVKRSQAQTPQATKTLLGLTFPNPVGLAAGLDKNGDAIDALFGLGFGFIEIGAVTPRAQPGNAKPRVFRLKSAEALINRFGFNNRGVAYMVERLRRRKVPGIVGVNLGKNATTPLAQAADDYGYSLQHVYPYADFVTINISSPNTQALRSLQSQAELTALLTALKTTQAQCAAQHKRHVPLFVKISPDLDDDALQALCEVLLVQGVEGIITVNTTLDRSVVADEPRAKETGGLSGRPLFTRALHTVRRVAALTQKRLVIIGVGGISSPEDAQAMLAAGADLVQLYTALIYQGPGLVRQIINHLKG